MATNTKILQWLFPFYVWKRSAVLYSYSVCMEVCTVYRPERFMYLHQILCDFKWIYRYSGFTDREVWNKKCSKASHQQKATLILACLSFSWNHFASPLSIRALGCSSPQALLDQGLWCRSAPGQHGGPTASGQQQSQYTGSVIYLDPDSLKDC